MPITTTSPQLRVTLYLGDATKSSLQKTDLMSALGGYVRHVANASKNLEHYPLVFANKAGLENFRSMREAMTAQHHESRPLKTGNVDTDTGACFLHALRTVRAFDATQFRFSPEQRLYIVGHGGAGLDRIAVDGKVFSMRDVATTLKTVGVPKDIRDVRLTSCHSADVSVPPDLQTPDLGTYSRPIVEKTRFIGITVGETVRWAPAEHLSDALAEAGFNQAVVTGYHGAGIHFDGLRFPEHALRNPHVPTAPGYDANAAVRRSTVAQRFSSEVDY